VEYEDRISIATPEGVSLELSLAGLGSRFIASFLDVLVKALAIGLLALAIYLLGAGNSLGAAALSVLGFAIYVGYDVAFEVLGGGRTPGKRANGLRVMADDGTPEGLRQSMIRNVVRVLEGPATLYMPAVISILASARNQRLGDHAASTLVVRERHVLDRRGPAGGGPVTIPDHFDASAVTRDEVATVRRFLERRYALEHDARAGLARQLADNLRPKVTGVSQQGEAEPFLELLAAAKAR